MAESETVATASFAPYDQYEVRGAGAGRTACCAPLPPGSAHPPWHDPQLSRQLLRVAPCAAPLCWPPPTQVAIPLERAGDCLEEVGREVYGDAKLWEGARTPFLVRFVTGEDLYLSPATDGPVMYINHCTLRQGRVCASRAAARHAPARELRRAPPAALPQTCCTACSSHTAAEDYVSRSTGKVNDQFQRITQLFRQRCGARLHWGKEGWTRHSKCFDGATEYPNTWCHFGCAVQVRGWGQGSMCVQGAPLSPARPPSHASPRQDFDPTGKFKSEWDGWVFNARRGGANVTFASCCTPAGFLAACTCAPRDPCA